MFGFLNEQYITGPVGDEFRSLYARLSAFLAREHNTDGTHNIEVPAGVTPVGGILAYGALAAPSGWLLCDGSQVDRVTYKTLYEVIGTSFGVGNGTTTFNLPDLRGRHPLGKAASGTGATLGETGGELDHVHSVGAHTHSFSATSSSDGGHDHGGGTGASGSHTHGMDASGDYETAEAIFSSGFPLSQAGHTHAIDSVGDHTHNISSGGGHTHSVSGTTGSGAVGDSGDANAPFLAISFIIYAGV